MSAATDPGVELAGPGAWQRRTHVEHVWGTVVTFDLRGPQLDQSACADVLTEAVGFLHQVDAWFSTYRYDSAITLHRGGLLPVSQLPPPVQDVLAACRFARQVTGGVFDPWAVPGGVDPSGYVKGWAAGQEADRIVRAGIGNVVVNAGGDIACRGQQAPGELWSIGVIDPRDRQRVVRVVRLGDGCVATSGLYERGAHIVDPRTGRRETQLDSATVVGPDAGLADALATAALIAGPAAVEWFAALPDWSAYLVAGERASFFGPAFG